MKERKKYGLKAASCAAVLKEIIFAAILAGGRNIGTLKEIFFLQEKYLFLLLYHKMQQKPEELCSCAAEGGCPDNNSSNGSKSKILRLFINNRIF